MSSETIAKETAQNNKKRNPRVISNPNDIAALVLMQVDAVNSKKDELTASIKSMTDLTKQLARAYGEHTKMIQELQKRVKELEKNKAE